MTLNCGSKGIAVSLVPVTSAARIEARRAAKRRDSSILCTFNARTDGSESFTFTPQVLAQDVDLLNPPAALEARKHKLKRLVQSPNSFFMDVKCQVRRERARTCTHFFLFKIFIHRLADASAPTRRLRIVTMRNTSRELPTDWMTRRRLSSSPGLLQHHDCVLSLSNRRALRLLLCRPLPTDRW